MGVVEAFTSAKGKTDAVGLDIELEENTKNATDKTRVAVSKAARGLV